MQNKNSLIIAKTISFTGTTIFNAILSIWVLEVFNSSKILGNINGYVGIAAIICNLLGGIFADSRYLVKVLLISDFIACIVCFSIVEMGVIENLLWLYILVFILNASTYLASPLFKTLVYYILPKSEITKFNTDLSFLVQLVTIVMPPISTTLYTMGIVSINEAILLNGMSYLISFCVLIPLRKISSEEAKPNFNYIEALKYLFGKYDILLLVLTGGLLNAFLAGFNIYVPIFTTNIIKNPASYGYLISIESIGGILGILSVKWLDISKKILLERYLFGVSAVLLILVYSFKSVILIAIFTLILTFCLARYNVAIQSIIQQEISQKFLGKIFSIFFLIVNIGLSGGSFIFGQLFSFNNSPLLLVAGGFVVIDLLWYLAVRYNLGRN